ncbi:MAG: hypothetical protein MSA09_07965 [Lachnospiraceae bacterium]|nr:hypothetical protein [Lachnospiraceae bacterium]
MLQKQFHATYFTLQKPHFINLQKGTAYVPETLSFRTGKETLGVHCRKQGHLFIPALLRADRPSFVRSSGDSYPSRSFCDSEALLKCVIFSAASPYSGSALVFAARETLTFY